ncbi:MAG TPA: DUF5329 domain-containing protein, partial [Candidatus Binatia bacterium]
LGAVSSDVDQTIEYLISRVERSDATFIRNGQSHNGIEAAEHLRSKYNYFKSRIDTPEDFIRLAGSKSELSGRPYQVKTGDGRLFTSAEWLSGMLAEYREAHPGTHSLPNRAPPSRS